VELGGPYNFYAEFRRAHGLMNLPHPEPPEIALQGHTTIVIPLWVRNRTGKAQEISLTVSLPTGWTLQSGAGKFTVAAKQLAAARIEVNVTNSSRNGNEEAGAAGNQRACEFERAIDRRDQASR